MGAVCHKGLTADKLRKQSSSRFDQICILLFLFFRNKADVVFVLDSSTSVRATNPPDGSYDNWQLLLEFVAQVVERLAVGFDSVSLIQYSGFFPV